MRGCQTARFPFRLDSLSRTQGPRPLPLVGRQLAFRLNFPSYFTSRPIVHFAVTHPPSIELATIPPTMKAKVPRVSISSLTRSGRSPTFSAETHRRLLEADRRWRAKCILRTLSIVFALIGFSLFAAAIPKWDSDFYWGGGPNRGDWEDGFPIGVVGTPNTVCRIRRLKLMNFPARIRIPLQHRYDLPDASTEDIHQTTRPPRHRFSCLGCPHSCNHFLSRSGSV
jgi:hypothetical protein